MGSHSLERYVVDLVTLNDESFVVEVNPFAEFAGTCLFSWSKDRELLTAESGFDFRVVEGTPKFPRANVNPEFLKILDRTIEEEGKTSRDCGEEVNAKSSFLS